MELTRTFMDLLVAFRPAFTEPSFATFQLLVTGWILSMRHRYVTDLIVTSDSVENGHFSDYHRFFSHAKWDIDDVWRILAGMLIGYFVGAGATILLAGDDTLCHKRGLGLFAAGMHHDPLSSSRKLKVFSWGHDWVTLCLVVVNPWWAPGSVFALPICMRLYRNRQGVTKGKKKPGRGRTPKKGKRLPTRDQWAADSAQWTAISFDQFGLHGTFETKARIGLYYTAGKDRPLKFVLTRDTDGQRPTRIFYCTNLDLEVEEILSTYAKRWAIEVTHHDAKQFLGLEDPANRLPLAVHRTAPTAMILYSLTVLWYAQHGHAHIQFPNRPWYRQKSKPSFADMLTTLRRTSWENELFSVREAPTLWKKAVARLVFLVSLAG